MFYRKISNKRQYGSTHIIFWESFHQKTMRFNPYWILRKFSLKDNTVQPILSFERVFTKRKYGSTHIVSWEKFWPKGNTVQPILSSFKKIFTKRQYGSIHTVFQENFHQKKIRFKPYCLLRKFWWIDNTVQSI